MSKLAELMEEMCPDGVEYKTFGEVCTLHARIGWQRLTRKEYQSDGDYLLITGTDFTTSYEVDYSTCVYVSGERYMQDPKIQLQNGDVLITKDGTIGKVAQVQNLPKPATLNTGVFVVRSKDGLLDHRFILHYLTSAHFMDVVEKRKTKGTISHMNQSLFSQLLIPVPPLPVQAEIVRILDKWADAHNGLIALLSREHHLRIKQYEYYRDKLLTFGDDVKIVKLCEVAVISRGVRVVRKQLAHEPSEGLYPVYQNSLKPLGWHNLHNCSGNTPFVISAGSAGEIGYSYSDFWAADDCLHINCSERLESRYLYHVLLKEQHAIKSQVRRAAVPRLPREAIDNLVIPVPTLEVQHRISSVLDRFETLTSSLTHGIPAEITARRKQYEYYRDKLLSFPPTSSLHAPSSSLSEICRKSS